MKETKKINDERETIIKRGRRRMTKEIKDNRDGR